MENKNKEILNELEDNKILDYDVTQFSEVIEEKSDYEVGLNGYFQLCLKVEKEGKYTKEKDLNLYFDDENFMNLLEQLKPYVLELIAREEMEKELDKINDEEKN